jgi:thiol-disulfide isomerase/thioredoxin
MRISTSLLLLTVSTFSSLASFGQIGHLLTAEFEGASENSKVYLSSKNGIIDSVTIANKLAKFPIFKKEPKWESFFIRYKDSEREYNFPVFHNSQSDISITVDKSFYKTKFTGGVHADEQNNFYAGLYSMYEQHQLIEKQLSEMTDSIKRNTLKKSIRPYEQQFQQYCSNWVTEHNASPFSVMIIRMHLNKTNVLDTIDTLAAKYFDQMLPEANANNDESFLLQREFALYSEAHSLVAVNSQAPEFSIKDTIGNIVNLIGYKGKWVLIDFWASWCIPCRQNNPLLKQLYLKYNQKGLEVLSISVDKESRKWKDAIIKDKMTWHHGSDLLGQDEGVGRDYQVFGVPVYFLISPEGRIVTKSLGGDIHAVEKVLDDILN